MNDTLVIQRKNVSQSSTTTKNSKNVQATPLSEDVWTSDVIRKNRPQPTGISRSGRLSIKSVMNVSFGDHGAERADVNYKIGAFITVVCMSLFICYAGSRFTQNFLLAVGINFVHQCGSIFLLYKVLWEAPHIYSVRVPTTVISDWVQMSMPSSSPLVIRKNAVVMSISELAGIRGSYMQTNLRVVMSVELALTLCAIILDANQRQSDFFHIQSSADIVPICNLLSALGGFLVGYFDLNMMCETHKFLHYLGVAGFFLGSFSLGFALQWNTLSIALTITQFLVLLVYVIFSDFIAPKKSDDPRIVTMYSKACIALELLWFQIIVPMGALSVYASGANAGNMWASPFLGSQ